MREGVSRGAIAGFAGPSSVRAYTWILCALVGIYGLFVFWRIWLPLEINGNEPWNAYHIDDAFSLRRLYPPTDVMINNYTPLSYYLLGAAAPFFPNSIVAGRVASFLSILAISFAGFGVSRQLGASRRASVFAGLWFCATMFRGYTNYAGMNDPHLLGLAVMSAAYYAFLRLRATPWVYAAFLGFIAAGLIKNSLLALPLSAILLLFMERNPRRLGVVLFCAACVLATVCLFYGLYGETFFQQIFIPRTIRLSRIVGSFQRIQWIAIPLLFWAFGFRRLGVSARRVTGLLIVSSWLVWWSTCVAEGVGTNAIFELVFAASVALACAASAAFETRLETPFGAVRVGALVYGLILIRLVASLDFAPYALLFDPAYRSEIGVRAAGMREDVGFVRAASGRMHCSVMTVCYLAGKPYDLGAPTLTLRSQDMWPSKP